MLIMLSMMIMRGMFMTDDRDINQYRRPANKILMSGKKNACIIICEGPQDKKILSQINEFKCLNKGDVYIDWRTGGKHALIKEVKTLLANGCKHVVGIYDSDFDDNSDLDKQHFVAYEYRDLECFLIHLGGLKLILNQFTTPHSEYDKKSNSLPVSRDSISKDLGDDDVLNSIAEAILSSVKVLSNLRHFNVYYNLGVSFDRLKDEKNFYNYFEIRNGGSFTIAIKDSFYKDIEKNANTPVGIDDIKKFASDSTWDDGLGPRGKDVIHAICFFLIKKLKVRTNYGAVSNLLCVQGSLLLNGSPEGLSWISSVVKKLE